MVGTVRTKRAEDVPEDSPVREERLRRALAADATNGWALWLLSKVYLRKAEEAIAVAEKCRAGNKQALARNDDSLARRFEQKEKEAERARRFCLEQAERLAHRGARSFNSVGCFKQLASIHMRQGKTAQAETRWRTVTQIKPNDVEAIERLGLIRLHERKWEELRQLCDRTLPRHPDNANLHLYKAYLAREEKNAPEFYRYVRQAHLLMRQTDATTFFDPGDLETVLRVGRLVEATAGRDGTRPPGVP
jgi:tetratricopeptide (TPR) repeat protein